MPRYVIAFDRLIETDMTVPGAIETAPTDTPPDVTIRLLPQDAADAPSPDAPIWSFADDTLDFAAPGVARYRCTARAVTVSPVSSAAPGDVAGLLVATALPALLWLQGAFMLHATAVLPRGEDEAWAFAGPSGIGKSMLADAFLRQGARLVADDSIAIRQIGDAAICSGLPGGYHLGSEVAGDRPFHPVAPDLACRSAPLGAIVVLGDAPHGRLRSAAAVEALLANRHRPNALRHAGLEPRSLIDAGFLARTVPIYTWPATQARALLDEDVRQSMTQMRDR